MHSFNEIVVSPQARPVQIVPAPNPGKEFSVQDLWSVFWRRRSIVIASVLSCLLIAIVVCIVSTRRYKGVGVVQVQKESADALGLNNMLGSTEAATDSLDTNITIQTFAQMLESQALALKVIEDLNLEKTQDFQPKFSLVGWVVDQFSHESAPEPVHATLDTSPRRRARVLKVFDKNLKVKPVSGTRLIEVSYLNPDPAVAAAVVNHLISGLTDFNYQTRYDATQQASRWLGGQLADLRKQSQDLQTKVAQLQRESDVFTLGDIDQQGRQQAYSTALDNLQQATAQLNQAQSSRIMKGALYEAVKSGDPELISGLAGTQVLSSSSSAGVSSSLSLIQSLRASEATVEGQLHELTAKFGPAYPKVSEVKANLESIEHSLHDEGQRVAERARNDYQISQNVETSARSVYATQKQRADALNSKAVEYAIVRQEADQSRSLYENLLTRLKGAGVLAGLRSSNITVVDAATIPFKPAKPNVLLYLAGSILGGLFLGACGALLRDSADARIHNLQDLEKSLSDIRMGVLPFHKAGRQGKKLIGDRPLAVLEQPRSPYAEALRSLRTALLLGQRGTQPQVVLVTSSVPGEGKSMLSVNLAALLAHQGKKVLMVDADMRRPNQGPAGGSQNVGLSLLLNNSSQAGAPATLPIHGVSGLHLVPAGPIPTQPAELLGSEQMREALRNWRKEYDFIVIDGPPLLPVTDSVLLSTMADLTLLVARHNVTELPALNRSCRLLESYAGKQKLAVVLNAVDTSADAYRAYYGEKASSYYRTAKHA